MKKTLILIWSVFLASGCITGSDPLVGSWVEPIPGQAGALQGIRFSPDGKATSINMNTLLYEHWSRTGDTLLLSGSSIGNGQTFTFTDTLIVKKLTPDSLVIAQQEIWWRYRRQK